MALRTSVRVDEVASLNDWFFGRKVIYTKVHMLQFPVGIKCLHNSVMPASVVTVTVMVCQYLAALAKVILLGASGSPEDLRYPPSSFSSFFLGFGIFLLSFGGAATFPTIQNDMRDRSKFSHSLVIAFTEFGWRRCCLRSSVVVLDVVLGMAVPDFGVILNLVAGSAIAFMSFVMPPVCYVRLCDSKDDLRNPMS
ncbi:uncharacterized protein [Macrobrachium rosenbergii]|uniref:uncharacterized protein n=1 Tax=Macrobrachium rosenbergii TaxID=79674 RepID=UPI0034D40896